MPGVLDARAGRRSSCSWRVVGGGEVGLAFARGRDLAKVAGRVQATPPFGDGSAGVTARLEVQPITRSREERLAARFFKWVTCGVLAGLVVATLMFEWQLLRTSVVAQPYPMPVYYLIATPGTSDVPGSPGAAGADFSQVYTSAQALRHGQSAYRPKSKRYRDHWGRPPGYPPLMNWVAVPFSYVRYANALVLYSAVSLGGLLAAGVYLLRKLGLQRHAWRVGLAQLALFFLTPIGATHLERGQFDLVVATAATLSVGCMLLPAASFWTAPLSGLLGALKWTSVAFLGPLSGLGFVLGAGWRRWAMCLVPVMMAAGTFPFWESLKEYWTTIQVYEIDAAPHGLTLQYFMPRAVARAMPLLLMALVGGFAFFKFRSAQQRDAMLRQLCAPYAIAMMNLAICFGTLSYEYHTVAGLGLLPVFAVWLERAEAVSLGIKTFTSVLYGALLLMAFRVYAIGSFLEPQTITLLYVGSAFLLTCVCLLIVARTPRAPAAGGAVVAEPAPVGEPGLAAEPS